VSDLIDVASTPAIPFSRLVRVELRKMADTRAGRWLLAAVGVLTALVLAIQLIVLLGQDRTATFGSFGAGANVPMVVLLPVLGVMSVTSEWSQRTAMVTFALVPSRGRVIGAKYVSALLIAIAGTIVAFVLMTLANLVYGALSSHQQVWGVGPTDFLEIALVYVLALSTGFAFGSALLNTAAAVVVYFVYNFVLSGLFELGAATMNWFDDLRRWIDFSAAQAPLQNTDALSRGEWGHLVVSGLIWLGIPLAVGVRRMLRAEVK
jgi:ABC-type transport system involved in multi-copper enzyme maturation permease subunit